MKNSEDSEDGIDNDEEVESDDRDEHDDLSQTDDDDIEQETDEGSDRDQTVDEEEEEDTDGEDGNSADDFDDADDTFQHMSNTDVSTQVNKGLCVKNQLNVWENLLEMRIHLQKCLIAANKMPPHNNYQEMRMEIGKDFTEKVSETKASLGNFLDKLLLLQKLVRKKYPETRKFGNKDDGNKNSDEVANGDDDEEIPSDTDNEEQEEETVEVENGKDEEDKGGIPVKKRKLTADYEQEIAESFKVYKPYRNGVIQKWHEKTRLVLMKSNAVSPSIIEHIEHVLRDRSKLLKRTQLRRSDYKIIGEKNADDGQATKQESEETPSRISQLYNTEIFDDDDFYHQLLRELIEVKSAGITDPVQLGRQWIQLQNLRSKMKRKIDTKATKGRKIRYTVHTKLVNFMAPIDENTWTDEAKNELYSSLFGKKQVTGS